ncbi:hypothetical protein PC9H_010496 [Pleurotus ostreatus]|uniref:Uncharacterized protein n=2 Tax=Pleurotus TaxID=5320 RepID=A0A8H7DPS8_PLEOS|nr:uncharacterized protein PC9H_010496 [Pleurotus ostreatus]KAF7422340.1 hypothetical protein PC9H_010496 [Pleurotus ostreatus]KAG9227766.1 hypothetical protein CCMSSC00406_0000588 [Pleurotus cornucopiae]KAJ8691834.1 hypothetical protein PTI98_011363 [Pleurotus ostreatus]
MTGDEDYPSLLWIAIPTAVLLSGYFARKFYLAYRLKKYGIGRGAPGFQTNVRKVRITPEIAARIRRGEDVSPEEITAAIAKAEREESQQTSSSPPPPIHRAPLIEKTEPTINEWLPDSITTPKKRAKGKKK